MTDGDTAAAAAATEAIDQLAAELGGPPAAWLGALAPQEIAHLARALDAAQRRQVEALAEAIESALTVVPGMLRPVVRRVLVGGQE